MDERFHYKHQMAIVRKQYLNKCRIAHGSPPPDNNIAHVHRGGFSDNINNGVAERKEHNFKGNPRPGLVQVKEEEIRNVISLSSLGNPDPTQPFGASQGRKRDANDGVSKSRAQSGNTFPDALGMVDQLGSSPHADSLLHRPKVENHLDFALEKYKIEVSMHPPQNGSEFSVLNFQQQCQVESSRSTSLKRKGVPIVALKLEEVQRLKRRKTKSQNLEVKTTDLTNLLDDLSKDLDVDGLEDGHNDRAEKYVWDTLWGDSSMRDKRGSIEGLPGPCEIQMEDTNVDLVGNANYVAHEIQARNTNPTPMVHKKCEVICLNMENDDGNMALCDWHIDNSHCQEVAKLEIENDSDLMHTNMDAEKTKEEICVVSSITAAGRFMHAKPPMASPLADVSLLGNLATPPPGSRVNLEGMNGRASSSLPIKYPCDQVQLSRTTYGHGIYGCGPIACGTSQCAKPSSTHIPPHENPPRCTPGSGVVLHGKNGPNVVGPQLNAQIPNEQVSLFRDAFGHGVSYSSEPGPSNVDNCCPHSRIPNQSVRRLTWNNKTKKTSKLKQWRREHFKEQLWKRHSVEELKRRESVGKVQGLPTTKGTVRHTMHSSPSIPLPSLLGTSKTQANLGLSGAQRSKPALVPSQSDNEKKSSQRQGLKNIRDCPIHGVAKVESILEGHKNLGPVKNEINTSHVKNIRPVNKENNQLSLVKPVYDTTISTPRDVVTRTLESYDYHVRVASLKLQEERREPAQQGRGVGRFPAQMRGTGHSPAPSSHRPDIQAYTAVRDAQEDVHRQVVFGDVPGVEVGDRYKFRHRMAVVGLHHLPNCGIAFGSLPPDNISLASAVVYVPKGGYADNVDNGHEVIYTGQGGRADRTQGAPFIEHQKAKKGNKALLMNIDRDVPVRMIRAHINMTQANHTKTLGYTYDGLYKVDSYKYELGVGGYNVYKFLLRRLDHQPPIPPCIRGCTTHPWNDGQGVLTPLPLQVVAPKYEVQQLLGVEEDNDLEHGI